MCDLTEELKPCPFCGGNAELDRNRHYRNISTGNFGCSVAVYCLDCNADMCLCREDMPDETLTDLVFFLQEQWNTRA